MHGTTRAGTIALLLLLLVNARPGAQVTTTWKQHDPDRPRPPKVDAGAAPRTGVITPPPSDAIILFDGRDLSAWQGRDGSAAWKVENGFIEVVPGSGEIRTRAGFGDVQLHIEWATPSPAEGTGQEPGNSGVFLMSRYEVQVLDSWENITYADGQAGALYGQFPPLVNASRPPGEWQSYDIVFHRPRFAANGTVLSPARMTVLHNGVLIHDAVAMLGSTTHNAPPQYSRHPDRLPLSLQDHGQRVRFRNIWVRDLEK